MEKKKIYLASPWGFTESGRYFMHKVMIPMLKENYTVLDPWTIGAKYEEEFEQALKIEDLTKRMTRWWDILDETPKHDLAMVAESDYLLAVLDGPDVDSGVALEIGYAYASGKTMLGYRSDIRQAGEVPPLKVNVIIECCIRLSGKGVNGGKGGKICGNIHKNIAAGIPKDITAMEELKKALPEYFT